MNKFDKNLIKISKVEEVTEKNVAQVATLPEFLKEEDDDNLTVGTTIKNKGALAYTGARQRK